MSTGEGRTDVIVLQNCDTVLVSSPEPQAPTAVYLS